MNDELKARAEQDPNWRGVYFDGKGIVSRGMNWTDEQRAALLEAFHAAIATERERCARIADKAHDYWGEKAPEGVDLAAALDIAAAIRAGE